MKERNSTHAHGRNALRRHKWQLQTYRKGNFLQRTRNSIFGLIDIYNLLPIEVVQREEVHSFQTELQALLKVQAGTGELGWEMLFSPRLELHNHPLRRLLNRVSTTNDGTWTMDDGGIFTPEVGAPLRDMPPSWW